MLLKFEEDTVNGSGITPEVGPRRASVGFSRAHHER